MRIIGGNLRGKKIKYLSSAITRPLRDFVKESIFNIIKHSSLINVSIENSNVLDLYAGVGSFGIECISRGAKKTTFVENDNKALVVLKKNLNHLKIDQKSEVFSTKIISFLNRSKKGEYEIIFFDPPFAENFFIKELKLLKNIGICRENHIIVIHRDGKSMDSLKGLLNIIVTKKYGRSKIIFANLG